MSTDWSFQFLTLAGGLGREHLRSLFAEAGRLGFPATDAASGDIVGMAGDGMGELRFQTLDTTLDWLTSERRIGSDGA